MFALNPGDGPPRLFRFVKPGTLPGRELLALYDRTKNLLIIDQDSFDLLDELEQREVLRTQSNVLKASWPHPVQVPA